MTCYSNFVFTINNYDASDITSMKQMDFCYLIYGFEVGANGTPHIQGYMELNKKTRFTTLKKRMPRAHIEHRLGTQKQAADYCKKEGKFEELGVMKVQGRRTDLDNVRQMALDGGMGAVSSVYNAQQIKVAEKFLSYNEPERDFKPLVIWLYGPTGAGKSRMAREIIGTDDVYTKNTGTKWWDGYDGHVGVILDDFRPSWWDLTYMLGLLDRYPFQVEFKGGYRQMRAQTMVVTSALPPHACYVGTGECVQQLLRRIDIVEFVGPAAGHDVQEVGGNTNAPTFGTIDVSPEIQENAMSMLELLLLNS